MSLRLIKGCLGVTKKRSSDFGYCMYCGVAADSIASVTCSALDSERYITAQISSCARHRVRPYNIHLDADRIAARHDDANKELVCSVRINDGVVTEE